MTVKGHELIERVIQANGFCAEDVIESENGPRSVYDIVEAHLMAAFDELEDD